MPIIFNILAAILSLGLSFWFNSDKSLKYEIPFDFAATRKIIKNSSIAAEFKIKNLCLAVGVALNCVANGKILNNKISCSKE